MSHVICSEKADTIVKRQLKFIPFMSFPLISKTKSTLIFSVVCFWLPICGFWHILSPAYCYIHRNSDYWNIKPGTAFSIMV